MVENIAIPIPHILVPIVNNYAFPVAVHDDVAVLERVQYLRFAHKPLRNDFFIWIVVAVVSAYDRIPWSYGKDKLHLTGGA